MCIAVFMWQDHPLYPFILLVNRDEYYSRPTKPAYWWEEGDILGGRDELAGGTWLATSRRGRFAFLTNVREKHSVPQAKSRGDLPVQFLKSKKDPTKFAQEIVKEEHKYNGFNLILVDVQSKSFIYVTNRPKEADPAIQQVSPGIHVLSNANLNTPWFKTERLQHNLKEYMKTCREADELNVKEMIEKLMKDPVKADKSKLPGIYDPEFEYQLSSIFLEETISARGNYGTRSITAVTVKVGGEQQRIERSAGPWLSWLRASPQNLAWLRGAGFDYWLLRPPRFIISMLS